MRIIDLRNRQSANVENAQAIRRIFESLGRAETSRQNRRRTTNVLHAMAAGSTPEQISQAALSGPGFDTGFQGFIQRLGAQFAPNVVSPIEQQIARQGLTRAFQDPLIREQRKASIESTKALTEQRKRRKTTTGTSDLQKQWEFKRKQRTLLVERMEDVLDEAEIERMKEEIRKIDAEMKELLNPGGPAEPLSNEISPAFFDGKGLQPGSFTGAPQPRDIKSSFGSIAAGSGNFLQRSTGSRQKSPYKIGDTVKKGGRQWKVVGFDEDGTPLVEEI